MVFQSEADFPHSITLTTEFCSFIEEEISNLCIWWLCDHAHTCVEDVWDIL